MPGAVGTMMGWKVLTASRSSRNRKRFSAVLVSSNLKPCTHWPGGVVSTRSRRAVWMAEMEGRSQSAAMTWRMPLFRTWMWASMIAVHGDDFGVADDGLGRGWGGGHDFTFCRRSNPYGYY